MTSNQPDLDAIEARAAGLYEYATGLDAAWQDEADQLAGTDVPALVEENRRLRARVAELEARHLPKLCECGHTRLVHTVPAPHGCFAGKIKGAEPCDCGEYRQLSFAEAERRIAERHAAQAEQRAAAEETHVVADDSDDPEHIDDCPGCDTDTLPAWLAQRFDPRGPGWDALSDDDRAYWEHQARAVRRAVARNGFKPTPPAAV